MWNSMCASTKTNITVQEVAETFTGGTSICHMSKSSRINLKKSILSIKKGQ